MSLPQRIVGGLDEDGHPVSELREQRLKGAHSV